LNYEQYREACRTGDFTVAKHNPPLTLGDLRAALLHDTRKAHAREIEKIERAKTLIALENYVMEFGSSKTIKLFDRFEEEA
jgi:hypothetical protein